MSASIAMIGFGALGGSAYQMLLAMGASVAGVLVPHDSQISQGPPVARSLAELLALKPSVVIECAGQGALRDYGPQVLAAGIDLVPASVGLFADQGFLDVMLNAAEKGGSVIRVPSGAMVGIDGLSAARLVGVERVTYRGTMAPQALKNFQATGTIEGRVLAYEGTAREAVFKFPKNANLTATIALASVGFDKTRVELYVDPTVTSNIHELEASGDFGSIHVKVSGRRISESSPSSRIVAGSLVQAAVGSNFTRLSGASKV